MVDSSSAATWHIFSKASHSGEFCALSVLFQRTRWYSESFTLDEIDCFISMAN